MLIEWTSNYSVENEKIDAQHQKLFDIVNRLHAAMTEKKGIDAVNSTLKELESYAAEHFQTEEILMKQNGYPDYPSHKQEHDEFIEKIEDLKKKFEKQKETYTVPIETWIFLKNWLNQHIMGTDKQYVPFFQEKGIQ